MRYLCQTNPQTLRSPWQQCPQPSCLHSAPQRKRAHSYTKDFVQFVTRKYFCTSRPHADCCCYSDSNNAFHMPSTFQISTKAGIRAPQVQLLQSSPLSHLQGVHCKTLQSSAWKCSRCLITAEWDWEREEKFSEISSTRKDVVAKGQKQEKGRRRRGKGE